MNYEDFLSEIEHPTVVDFWAEWCSPCKMFSPVFDEASKKYPEVNFIKINVDDNEQLCQELGIMSIPAIHFYVNGIYMDEITGSLNSVEFYNFIEENLL